MKNAEGVALSVELDRRLKQSIEHLRDVRETLEELGRTAGTLHRLFGAEQLQGGTQATSAARPAGKTEEGRTQMEQSRKTSHSRSSPGSASSASAAQDEVPVWRKVFPALSAEVPGRRK